MHVAFLVRFLPNIIKSKGVNEKELIICGDTVHKLVDHAIGLGTDPRIDVFGGRWVERRRERLRVKGVFAGGEVILRDAEVI